MPGRAIETREPGKPRKVALIYVDSGGGHRAAAAALSDVIRQQQRPWSLEMFSIQDLLDSIDFIRKLTGIPFQDVHNILLRHVWFGASDPPGPSSDPVEPPLPSRRIGTLLGAAAPGFGGFAASSLQPRA